MTDLNPIYETIGGIKMRLTEICHSAGMSARITRGNDDAYYQAYYDILRRFMPDHPALENVP